jgi:hypothetical protein
MGQNHVPKSTMRRTTQDIQRALLLGTLIGMSLIADTLVRAGVIEREELVAPLAQAEALAKDERGISLSMLRRLIEKGYEAIEDSETPPTQH